jgi:hypothetical protein
MAIRSDNRGGDRGDVSKVGMEVEVNHVLERLEACILWFIRRENSI